VRPKWSGLTHGRPNPVVCGRKFCTGCGHWRHACDFSLKTHHGTRRLDSYCQACRRIQWRQRYQHMTPQQREARRETERFYRDRLRVERGTIGRYQPRGPSVIDRKERVMLDPAPLIAELRRSGVGQRELERMTGVPPRSIYRVLVGEVKHVQLDTADKLAHALGIPLALMYGDRR
jgi:hypothetical protein